VTNTPPAVIFCARSGGTRRTRMSTTLSSSFADLLHQHRLAAGLTQEALAERAGMSVHGIQKLERSATRPYRDTTNRLIDALGLTGEARSEFEAAGAPGPRRRAALTVRQTEVILYHAAEDGPTVERVAAQLREAGLSPHAESAVSGQQDVAAHAAGNSSESTTPCAVFVSATALSNWDTGPLGSVLRSPERTGVPTLIPVLLPGAPEPLLAGTLPSVLQTRPWVDFRAGLDNAHVLAQLVAAIRGLPIGQANSPEPLVESACPYRGLETFEPQHADLFFGREADVQRLLEHLKASRLSRSSRLLEAASRR
jgi:transcriptional regulator with XRE-family HTH domain